MNKKTMTVETGHHSDGQSYSGTIEEQSGSMLNFSSVGTLHSIHVSEGQIRKNDPMQVRIAAARHRTLLSLW